MMEVKCWRQPRHLGELLYLELQVLDPAVLLLQLLDEVPGRGLLRAAGLGHGAGRGARDRGEGGHRGVGGDPLVVVISFVALGNVLVKNRAANKPSAKFSQSQRRPLLALA